MRCGACLKVFVADDNLLPSADLQTVEKPVRQEVDESASEEVSESESPESVSFEMAEKDMLEPEESREPVILEDRFEESALNETEPHWVLIEETDDSPAPSPSADSDDSPEQIQAVPGFSALDDDFPFTQDATPASAAPTLNTENLRSIASARDSLELEWRDNSGQKSRSAWWLVALIILATTLIFQFVYFQWTVLGQNPALRPWLQRVCETLPCTLAPMTDMRSIGTDNLDVRSHAEIANALTVTLTFRNQSEFVLALPELNLHFLNADNEVIAARQFSPDEYLPPALAGLQVLPAGAPVQVALDIIDPGMEAVNYEVSFSPYTAR